MSGSSSAAWRFPRGAVSESEPKAGESGLAVGTRGALGAGRACLRLPEREALHRREPRVHPVGRMRRGEQQCVCEDLRGAGGVRRAGGIPGHHVSCVGGSTDGGATQRRLLGSASSWPWGIRLCAYLTYLELYVIEAICAWCVVSAILITLLTIVGGINLRRTTRQSLNTSPSPSALRP
jgi:hypothetical protein